MSEYQRYEFMTIDRPLTREQLTEVKGLSSHIEASSTHALIEYNWGDFKHDPLKVLHKFFDGFLYWANWGSPQFALRFPHGTLPADFIESYDFDEFVTFTKHSDYDILNIEFGEMQSPDMWATYELGSLVALRDELQQGDLRGLYIVWLASQSAIFGDYEDRDEDDEGDDEEEIEDETSSIPPVPPEFGNLTEAQQALTELLQVPQELLAAAAQYSNPATPETKDDFATWIELLPQERRNVYLARLARNEPGLSRLLIKELRELNQSKAKATPFTGKRVSYHTLLAESENIRIRQEREEREQEQLARQQHLQEVHDQQNQYWQQVDQAMARKGSTGYDEVTRLLVDLRDAAGQFKETQTFQARFHAWLQPYLRRPALVQRLRENKFTLSDV